MTVVDCLPITGTDAASFLPVVLISVSLVMIGMTLVLVRGRAKRARPGSRAAIVALVVLLGVTMAGADTAHPAIAGDACMPFNATGSWQGTVPTTFSPPYEESVAIVDDGTTASATANYPTLSCASTWAQTARVGSTITFLETITEPFDPAQCSTGGTITITPNGDPVGSTLAWTYQYALTIDPNGAFSQATTLYPVP